MSFCVGPCGDCLTQRISDLGLLPILIETQEEHLGFPGGVREGEHYDNPPSASGLSSPKPVWFWGTANHGHIHLFPTWVFLGSGYPEAWDHVVGPNTGHHA